jgi:hypothetical protein
MLCHAFFDAPTNICFLRESEKGQILFENLRGCDCLSKQHRSATCDALFKNTP